MKELLYILFAILSSVIIIGPSIVSIGVNAFGVAIGKVNAIGGLAIGGGAMLLEVLPLAGVMLLEV